MKCICLVLGTCDVGDATRSFSPLPVPVMRLRTGATSSLVEQRPKWALVHLGQAEMLQCFLKDTQYPWMSWYQQDLQGQLQVLASLRFSGDKEVVSLPGADYQVTRVDDKELRLHVANVTQGRTLYCSCSKDTVRNSPWTNE